MCPRHYHLEGDGVFASEMLVVDFVLKETLFLGEMRHPKSDCVMVAWFVCREGGLEIEPELGYQSGQAGCIESAAEIDHTREALVEGLVVTAIEEGIVALLAAYAYQYLCVQGDGDRLGRRGLLVVEIAAVA